MNVLLVNPTFPDTFWSFRHALTFVRKRAAFPPLGLLTVAALLPREWSVRVVDTNVQALRDADIVWANLAFLGGMAVQRESARQILARCHALGVRVVAGGPLFTSEPEALPDVDHLVLNEAELTLPRFLADLKRGAAQRTYTSAEYPDLTRTPAPRWDLLDVRHYASLALQYSRGCPYDCEFCNVTALFGHRPRTKTPDQVVAELDAVYRAGWRGPVFFVDDNLIGNKRALKDDLLPALIAWGRGKQPLSLQTEVSINVADDPELMRRMVEAGFDTVFVGIETPDESGLRECNKKQNQNRDLRDDVRRIHRAGLQVQGGFIVGFDSDTPATFERQLRFIQETGVVTAMVGLLQAPPGTRLHSRMEREGRLLGPLTGDNVDGTTNIRTRMGLTALRQGHRRILRTLYAPGPYYRRVKTFLRDYQRPARRIRLRVPDLLAFLRSVVRLGVVGRGRVHYWRLLGWACLRRRQHVSLAVTLWIYGHHFRKISRTLAQHPGV
jgi:radical SAM superfamily enzyme YgiQ (UPF0313 family)